MRKGIIYQFDNDLVLIGQYDSLLDAQFVTGINWKTISSSINRNARCRGMFFFSREQVVIPKKDYLMEPLGLSITLKLPKTLGEEFLRLLKNRNKQDILRKLCLDWVNQEKGLKDGQFTDKEAINA